MASSSPTLSDSSLATVISTGSPTPSYSPITPLSTSPENQQTIESTTSPPSSSPGASIVKPVPKYSVASHSVRITKHGFAIDPLELRYPEVTNQLSTSSRRNSEVAFSSKEVGHQVLDLIRGFWSQPAFPRGRVVKSDSQRSVSSILNDFSRNPPYPHKDTYGSIGIKPPRTKSSRTKGKSSRDKTTSKINSLSFSSKQATDTGKSSSPEYATTSPKKPADESDDSLNSTSAKDAKFSSLSLSTAQQQQSAAARAASTTSGSNVATITKPKGSSSSTRRIRRPTSNDSILSLFVAKRSSKPSLSPPPSTPPPPQPPNTYHSWIPTNKEQICDLLTELCQQMERVFTNEARIINISSPCTVLGDIHGNLSDLRTYERSLWPKAPNCVSCNYLFLGDYVDRGDYSVECVLYLFAMKLIAPNRFFMLRGNHEVAAIQRQYTFSRECEAKFGPNGRQMWKNFNKVFDLMPVAAVIDSQIFCAHGGIPRSVGELKTLVKEIPSPLDNPEIQCPSAWEILWNDPITDSELVGMIEMDNAVVTQTQIGQQQQSTEANVKSAMPSQQTTAQTETNVAPIDGIPPTGIESPVTTTSTNATTAIHTPKKPIGAESILTRDPALSGALSFYIRPDTTSTGNQLLDGKGKAKSINNSTTKPPAISSSSDNKEVSYKKRKGQQTSDSSSSDTNDTLRTVPSDTSSIASTSPQQILNDGFVGNIKRGTAFLFSDQATKNFLKLNNLSHVIRAHEVIPTGFAFHGDGRVITIFSSSKYCGLNNQAACAYIDQERIRILRLDTGDAGE